VPPVESNNRVSVDRVGEVAGEVIKLACDLAQQNAGRLFMTLQGPSNLSNGELLGHDRKPPEQTNG